MKRPPALFVWDSRSELLMVAEIAVLLVLCAVLGFVVYEMWHTLWGKIYLGGSFIALVWLSYLCSTAPSAPPES